MEQYNFVSYHKQVCTVKKKSAKNVSLHVFETEKNILEILTDLNLLSPSVIQYSTYDILEVLGTFRRLVGKG